MHDDINSPKHYQIGGIDLIDALEQSMAKSPNDSFVDFCRGSAIQYLWRLGLKGDARKDAGKARWYINRLVSYLEQHATAETPAGPDAVSFSADHRGTVGGQSEVRHPGTGCTVQGGGRTETRSEPHWRPPVAEAACAEGGGP
jgi:hypothetical protein